MSDGIEPGHLLALIAGAAAPICGWLLVRRRAAFASANSLTRLIAALLAVTGGAHLGLVPHALDEPLTAFLFLVNAVLFLALGFLALQGRRWWRPAAGLLLTATILAYAVYVGLGWEGVDQAGMATKLVELCALGLIMLPAGTGRRLRQGLRWTGATASLLLLTLVAAAVPWAASLRPSDAGAHAHGANPVTVVEGYDRPATAADYAAAARLVAEVRAGIAAYADPRAALAAGYRPVSGPGEPLAHWQNDALRTVGGQLDARHPTGLVYAYTRRGPVLLGAYFQMAKIGVRGPNVAGPLMLWHHHTNICIAPVPGLIAGFNSPFRSCPFLSVAVSGPSMVHVWTVDNPGGPFAHDLDPRFVQKLLAGES